MDIEITNARYDRADKTTFTAYVVVKETGDEFPFTYKCDGSDDSSGAVAQAVGEAYRAGKLTIEDHVDIKLPDAFKARGLRIERDERLAASDYFMLPDYPASEEDRAAVAAYRQALRDLTAQEGFPHGVEWPEKPDCLA